MPRSVDHLQAHLAAHSDFVAVLESSVRRRGGFTAQRAYELGAVVAGEQTVIRLVHQKLGPGQILEALVSAGVVAMSMGVQDFFYLESLLAGFGHDVVLIPGWGL